MSRISCPSFKPPLGLENRHIQSVFSKFPWRRRRIRERAAALLGASVTEILDCGGGVRLQGFYSAPPPPRRGLVVLMHGWEGSADSSYVLSAGTALFAAGFEVFRLNFRDHGGTHALNDGLFHSCRIEEVVNAVKAVQSRHPSPLLALAGQSLGGNFAIRVAARAPEAGIDLSGVFAVCPVLEPESTMHALERGLFIYRNYFLRRWRGSLLAKAAMFPELYAFGNLARFPTLTATTEFFVREYTAFSNLGAYLKGYALTGPILENLRVPTRVVLAEDDPVIPYRDLANIARVTCLRVDVQRRGGHCGFVAGYGLRSWIDTQIAGEFA